MVHTYAIMAVVAYCCCGSFCSLSVYNIWLVAIHLFPVLDVGLYVVFLYHFQVFHYLLYIVFKVYRTVALYGHVIHLHLSLVLRQVFVPYFELAVAQCGYIFPEIVGLDGSVYH